ncbi:MAG: GrpB family protein [Geodermatophilaceae bacterium]|nr:GrpB family protein [Geodermatophilaceae bacterium]
MEVPAVVVAYDPMWPVEFEELRGRVDAALRGIDHTVEHVGSTAVPGLDAKPIVDVDVVVPRHREVRAATVALTGAGWRHRGDLGIAGRDAFDPPADGCYHHLYIVVAGTTAHCDHVDLRDYLRANPDEAARYAALKHGLAPLLAVDRSAYVEAKSAFIKELLERARGQAAT